MKTLILGAQGRLGTAFRRELPNAIPWGRRELDLARPDRIRALLMGVEPSLIINCAAYTAVDAAEEDENTANLINGVAVGELAAVADELRVPLVTYSTDYVFDGTTNDTYTESAIPAPLSAYGRSKLVGEQLALGYPGSLVIRTSWLLSSTHPSFVSTILNRATRGNVDVVDDQWGRPTIVDDLAAVSIAAIESGVTGILHLASPPTTTWFGLAQKACSFAGLDPGRIRPVASKTMSRRALRPRHAVLGSERGFVLPEWPSGLAAWLQKDAHLLGTDSHPAARPGPM